MATNLLFAKFPLNLGGGDAGGDGPMDLLSDTLKLMLATNADAPVQATDEVKGDITGELSTANGYTAGGATLASKVYSTTSLVTKFDADDVTWTITSGGITFRHAPLYDDTVATPADPLILNIDTGGNQTISSIDLVFQFNNPGGIFTFTVA